MVYFFQQLLNALQLGSIYALVALGYSIVYGILAMINFAHGDLFMVGAFLCFLGAAVFGLGFFPCMMLGMLGIACLGALIERLAYRPIREAPKVSAIITALGVGIFLENFLLAINQPVVWRTPAGSRSLLQEKISLALSPFPKHVPPLVSGAVWDIGGVAVSRLQLSIILLSLLLMAVLQLILRRTMLGKAMRAISWDRGSARLLGIPVDRVISAAFALGAGLGGAAGVMYAVAFPVVDTYMGVLVGWKAFVSSVIGGIGLVHGAVLGGYMLGAVEVLVAAFLPSTYRDFIAFGLLLVFLIIRPFGVLGRPKTIKV